MHVPRGSEHLGRKDIKPTLVDCREDWFPGEVTLCWSLQGGEGAGKGGEQAGWRWGFGPRVAVCKVLIRAPEPGELGLLSVLTGALSSRSRCLWGGWGYHWKPDDKLFSFSMPWMPPGNHWRVPGRRVILSEWGNAALAALWWMRCRNSAQRSEIYCSDLGLQWH